MSTRVVDRGTLHRSGSSHGRARHGAPTRSASTRSAPRASAGRAVRSAGVTRRGLPRGGRIGSPRRRLAITWIVAFVAALGLAARLIYLQVSPSDELVASGKSQWLDTRELQASRGAIVDRNGADLAISVPRISIGSNPEYVTDPKGDAEKLAPILGRDVADLQAALSSGKWVFLARQADQATADAVAALDLPHVEMYREDKRIRPSGDRLGLSLIGRTDVDQKGQSGVEKLYDDVLKGEPGSMLVEKGSGGRTIPGGEHEVSPASPGSDVVLTIDRSLQYEAERLLMAAVDEAEALAGTVLISDVATGEILADANVVRPKIEPDKIAPTEGGAAAQGDAAAPSTQTDAPPVYGPAQPTGENRAVTWTYEPGSVNKVIAMAGVLEEGLATPDTVRSVSSSVEIYDKRFAQESRSTDEDLSLREILARSDNLGTIMWANELGKERLYGYLTRFGLGRTTGLGLPGESSGKLPNVKNWSETSLPTIAFGQGIAVTPMQMLGVYNTIANDGLYVPPKVVLGTETPEGRFEPTPEAASQRVVSEATAAALRDMLTSVVQDGTGKNAQVDGYTVAGKTGTAWKPLPGGGYGVPGARELITTFVGFLPAGDPKITILVVLDTPSDPYATGGNLAAPLFQKIASYAVRHLRIPPDQESTPVNGERVRAEPQAAPATTVPSEPTSVTPAANTPATASSAVGAR